MLNFVESDGMSRVRVCHVGFISSILKSATVGRLVIHPSVALYSHVRPYVSAADARYADSRCPHDPSDTLHESAQCNEQAKNRESAYMLTMSVTAGAYLPGNNVSIRLFEKPPFGTFTWGSMSYRG